MNKCFFLKRCMFPFITVHVISRILMYLYFVMRKTLLDTLLVMFLDMTLNVLLLCIFCIYYSLIFACFICCSPVFYNFFSFFMFASMYVDEYFHRHDQVLKEKKNSSNKLCVFWVFLSL